MQNVTLHIYSVVCGESRIFRGPQPLNQVPVTSYQLPNTSPDGVCCECVAVININNSTIALGADDATCIYYLLKVANVV